MKRSHLFLVIAACVLGWNVWAYDLWAPDEPYFAEGAREMVVDGQWAVPHVNGEVTTDKPPLFFWLIALFSLPLGHVSSLSARLPSVLAALGSVALTVRLGGRLWGKRAGAWAGLFLLSTYLFWDKARTAQIDSLLCCLILVSLSAFEIFRAGEADGRRAGLLFWVACAFAVIAKGPIGLVVPLGIGLSTLALDRDLRAWKRFAPFSGPLAFAIVVGAWALLATIGGGGEYSVWGALKEHALGRAVFGMHHVQPPWYYLEVMPVQLLPWTALVPGALLLALRHRARAERFLLAWFAFLFVFFSAITEKRELYLLPACPVVALLLARLVTASEERLEKTADAARERFLNPRWVTVPLRITAAVFILTGGGLLFAASRLPAIPTHIIAMLAACLAASGAAIAWRLKQPRPEGAVRWVAFGMIAAYLVTVTAIFPSLEGIKSVRPFALRFKNLTAESRRRGDPVLSFRTGNLTDAIAFYSDGVYATSSTLADIERHLLRPDLVFAVADAPEINHLRQVVRDRIAIVDFATFGPTKLVLITNQAQNVSADGEGAAAEPRSTARLPGHP